MKNKKRTGVHVKSLTCKMEAAEKPDLPDESTRHGRQKRKRDSDASQGTFGCVRRLNGLPKSDAASQCEQHVAWQASNTGARSKLRLNRLASDVVAAGRSLWASEVLAPSGYLENHPLEGGSDSSQRSGKARLNSKTRKKFKKQMQEEIQNQESPIPGKNDIECVRAELLASTLMRYLHHKFAALCAAEGLKGKQHASIFERWHFASRVDAETSPSHLAAQLHHCLPWLGSRNADQSLLDDLQQAAVGDEAANRICLGIRDAVRASLDFKPRFSEADASQTCPITVAADGKNSLIVSAQCTIPPRILSSLGCDEVHTVSPLRIARQHYEKLRVLFDRAAGQSQKKNHGDKEQQDTDFHTALFCLLERYRGIKGGGFQAALPGIVFEVLLRDFGASVECFASPLNCRYGKFCSGFVDRDAQFGSLGSFFKFWPRQGSFQANPPFVPQLISTMCCHMRGLLARAQNAEDSLSFIVIVGASAGLKRSEAWQQLVGSEFLSHHLVVKLQHHRYKEGNQHFRKKGQVRMSSCDTSVFFLQTKAAIATWPVTTEKLDRLSLAFKS